MNFSKGQELIIRHYLNQVFCSHAVIFENELPCTALPTFPSFCSTMSDFEGDFDDELLELAGATEKKRKHHASNSRPSVTKKRRTE